MALFGPVEQRTLGARLLFGCVYLVLGLGSISMVYPFLLMLGASVTSDTDFDQWRVIPRYLYNDLALYQKWMDDRYGEDFDVGRRAHRLEIPHFRYLESIPPYSPDQPEMARRVDDWLECLRTLPDDLVVAFNIDQFRYRTTHQKFARWLQQRYHNDIHAYNQNFSSPYTRFSEAPPAEAYLSHKWRPDHSHAREEYLEFRRTLPAHDLMAVLASDGFRSYLERRAGNLEDINALLKTRYTSLSDIVMPMERPPEGPYRDAWDDYVAKRYPLEFIQMSGNYDAEYRAFLLKRHADYDERVRRYNAEHASRIPLLADTQYPLSMPSDDFTFAAWVDFTDQHVPASAKRLISVENLWRNWLRSHYGDLSAVNTAHGASWKSWDDIMPPRAETDVITFRRVKSGARWEFFTRNYAVVLDYMLYHGRAVWNTFVLVALTVLGQITVQPLAAYGLSRFRLPYAHRILLFLLATMAFPAEVAMIPNFLLIKELGLLNTYGALVLPGLASGMGIFLLKGYFDSLPSELYEAAMIDGAGELRMFWQITVPLSKPILAVIALGAFTGAYGGFMWAFLICQNPDMWTMMVYLFQMETYSYRSVWMASLVIAAIPTLLVFISCQNTILKGIIVPTMK